ncbi:MAG: hypothetical protein QM770_23590 [Tepidisphaeraceae bacterium]
MTTSSIPPVRFARRASVVAAAVAIWAFAPTLSFAQATPGENDTPAIETGSNSFAGAVNTDGALLRSGPSENDYATRRLTKGDKLTVVGMRFEWLKVLPPEGSFCLVPQALVEKRGDGTVGRVTHNAATVRVGSELTPNKHKVPMKLDVGADVQILGEVDEFYKIAPPAGVFLYVDKRFVDPVSATPIASNPTPTAPEPVTPKTPDPVTPTPAPTPEPVATGGTPTDTTGTTPAPDGGRFTVSSDGTSTPSPGGTPGTTGTTTPETGTTTGAGTTNTPPVIVTDTGKPTGVEPTTLKPINDTPVPSTKPAQVAKTGTGANAAALSLKMQALEKQYEAAGQQEITAQPIEELIASYQAVLEEQNLAPVWREIGTNRLATLQTRKEIRDDFVATRKAKEESDAKARELKAEEQELQQQFAESAVTRYKALGKLSNSSLQFGPGTLYRLTDPGTGRIVVYVRTADTSAGDMLGKFVGVKGKVVKDEARRITYIEPENFTVVDTTQVNVKVFGDFSPPSLAANAAGETQTTP